MFLMSGGIWKTRENATTRFNVVLICQSGALVRIAFQININLKGRTLRNQDVNSRLVLSAIVAIMNAFISISIGSSFCCAVV